MEILGQVSQYYMFILLILLFLGSGFAIWGFITFLMDKILKADVNENGKQSTQKNSAQKKINIKNMEEEL